MALPPDWNTVRVFGHYVNADGSDTRGRIRFDLVSGDTQDDSFVLIPRKVSAELVDGLFEVELPVTQAENTVYRVSEGIANGRGSYLIGLTPELTELDLSQSVPAPTGAAIVPGIRGPQGEIGPEGPKGDTGDITTQAQSALDTIAQTRGETLEARNTATSAATTASNAATAAGISATTATTSAGTAVEAATDLTEAVNAAAASALTAGQRATAADLSAQAAASAASTATSARNTATGAATTATTARDTAQDHAQAAGESASTASTAAGEASGSASAASEAAGQTQAAASRAVQLALGEYTVFIEDDDAITAGGYPVTRSARYAATMVRFYGEVLDGTSATVTVELNGVIAHGPVAIAFGTPVSQTISIPVAQGDRITYNVVAEAKRLWLQMDGGAA